MPYYQLGTITQCSVKPYYQLGTTPARSNIPYANDENIVVVLTKRDQGESTVLAILFFSIIPAAKPGPYSTKEHCTSRRWVSLNLGKRSTEIAHDKIEPQSAVLVINRVTNWYTTSVDVNEQSKIYKALHLCDYWRICLASPRKYLWWPNSRPFGNWKTTATICE